jgi:chaperonin cofactor prefoldin
MRPRKEIENELRNVKDVTNEIAHLDQETVRRLQLEVLLDVRDLLTRVDHRLLRLGSTPSQ